MFNVQILNASLFRAVTGTAPPPSPISAATYAQLGLPFFELMEDEGETSSSSSSSSSSLQGFFEGLKSVAQLEGGEAEEDEDPRVVTLNPEGPVERFRPFPRYMKDPGSVYVADFA